MRHEAEQGSDGHICATWICQSVAVHAGSGQEVVVRQAPHPPPVRAWWFHQGHHIEIVDRCGFEDDGSFVACVLDELDVPDESMAAQAASTATGRAGLGMLESRSPRSYLLAATLGVGAADLRGIDAGCRGELSRRSPSRPLLLPRSSNTGGGLSVRRFKVIRANPPRVETQTHQD
ncbi:hypothetical protein GCM10027020_09160 [Nocardioides salsibiostraticola]